MRKETREYACDICGLTFRIEDRNKETDFNLECNEVGRIYIDTRKATVFAASKAVHAPRTIRFQYEDICPDCFQSILDHIAFIKTEHAKNIDTGSLSDARN